MFLKFLTDKQRVSHREIWLSAACAIVALLFVAWLSYVLLGNAGVPYIFASMGASAVLIFAVPSSTMNRPWALFCSHTLAAVIGTSCALYIPNQVVAIVVAIGAVMVVMHYLRCMHPPGGATALLMVLSSEEVRAVGYQWVLTPVMLNTVLLILTSLIIRNALSVLHPKQLTWTTLEKLSQDENALTTQLPFAEEDLKAAMEQMDTYLDVQNNDLMALYQHAQHHQRKRCLGELRCSDLMNSDLPAAEYGTALIDVWRWFQEYEITAVPVVDRGRRVIGIVTLEDFIRHAEKFPQPELAQRIEALITPTPELTSNKPEVAGQIMSYPAITALDTSHVADLLTLLDSENIRHLPIVNNAQKLVGFVARSQIISKLSEASI